MLDVGCGWGALLERLSRRHGVRSGVGLTLSANQVRHARARGVPGTTYRLESWVDHRPERPYDAITAIESTEHFASDALSADDKVDVYRQFFDVGRRAGCGPAAGWGCSSSAWTASASRPAGWGRPRVGDLMGRDVFPESMPASLSEMVLGWETHFRLASFLDSTADYVRTFRAWALAYRGHRSAAEPLVGSEVARRFDRYFAAGEVCFRLREHALYRVVLAKRPQPKQWAIRSGRATSARPRCGRPPVRRRAPSGPTTTCRTTSTRRGWAPR